MATTSTRRRVVQAHGVEHAAQPQDHVAPALAAGWPVVELAEQAPELGLLGCDAARCRAAGQPVEHAELLLAQPLVDDELRRAGSRPPRHGSGRGLLRAA